MKAAFATVWICAAISTPPALPVPIPRSRYPAGAANGTDTDVYLHGGFAFRIQGVVAAAIDDTYSCFSKLKMAVRRDHEDRGADDGAGAYALKVPSTVKRVPDPNTRGESLQRTQKNYRLSASAVGWSRTRAARPLSAAVAIPHNIREWIR